MRRSTNDPALEPVEAALLEQTWAPKRGLAGWFTQTNHAVIGKRFVITAIIFLLLGGLEALAMRLQLATADGRLLGPDKYNQFFTVHGSTMMFLFAVPVMEGIGVYVVPMMIGTRSMAFPRLNAYSYFTYLCGGLFLYVPFLLNMGPDAGWFAYVPLAGPMFSAGKRVDVWAQLITFTEVSALTSAVNMVATILKHRAPGMSLSRMPLFVWAQLVMSAMIIFAMPAVMIASTLLATDRLVGTHFFNTPEGSDPLLWQHLFWFFGHPEVYIIFIPATGMVSTIVAVFTGRQVFGYPVMVLSLVAVAFLGFGLWVHHMFVTGIPQLGGSFFTAASIMIAVPNGLQLFCWIATLWSGKVRFSTPMLFVLSFIAIFVLGGLSGIMLATVPIDAQVHDTYFVVAHFHYVLIGGALFPLFGALHFWFPKMTGRLLSERLGRWNVAVMFVGFNLTFFPMHLLGLHGMPRRVYQYSEGTGWGELNLLATVGAFVLGTGILLFLINVAVSLRRGAVAGADPWAGDTLEWSLPSPPPSYGFLRLPTVRGPGALWTRADDQPVVTGLRLNKRELLVTGVLDAEVDHVTELPKDSWSPLLATLASGFTFVTAIFTPWAVPLGFVLGAAALMVWFWPRPPYKELLEQQP